MTTKKFAAINKEIISYQVAKFGCTEGKETNVLLRWSSFRQTMILVISLKSLQLYVCEAIVFPGIKGTPRDSQRARDAVSPRHTRRVLSIIRAT